MAETLTYPKIFDFITQLIDDINKGSVEIATSSDSSSSSSSSSSPSKKSTSSSSSSSSSSTSNSSSSNSTSSSSSSSSKKQIVKGKVPESKKNIITKIVELAKKNGITDRERLTCILAVAGGETQWNPGSSESFNYSLKSAKSLFSKLAALSDQEALKYLPKRKDNPLATGSEEKLANFLYGGRYGNKDDEGWKYRGRGMTQITFKGNYENVQNKLITKYFPEKGNIVSNPDLVNDTDISVAILVYGKISGFFGDNLIQGDQAYLSNPVRIQATQNGSNGKGKRRENKTTPNYENALNAINNTPWVQSLIN